MMLSVQPPICLNNIPLALERFSVPLRNCCRCAQRGRCYLAGFICGRQTVLHSSQRISLQSRQIGGLSATPLQRLQTQSDQCFSTLGRQIYDFISDATLLAASTAALPTSMDLFLNMCDINSGHCFNIISDTNNYATNLSIITNLKSSFHHYD